MNFRKKISALKVPHHKNTAGMHSVRISPPKEVLLPMSMHSGAPAVPVVEVGDHVRIGQLIAREDGKISSPVHATISGTVKAIETFTPNGGRPGLAIRIESDGKMEKDPNIVPPQIHDLDSFLAAVQESGIVGLGGAAFPLWAKLDAVRRNPIKTVLVNGAECEPYITSDNRTMVENSGYIVKGVELLREYLKAEEFIIGIEENKPDAIEEMRRVFAGDSTVNVMPLKSVYPQGAKQVLLYNATGKVVAEGQRLAELNVIIINITSLAKMAQYIEDGMPLVEKCLTVDGSAIKEPKNLIVPIGTPIRYLVEQAGGLKSEPGKVIYGGPMMGKTARSLDEPVIKASNAIIVMDQKDAQKAEPSPCIHCGRCVATCPLSLNPTAFAKAMDIEDEDKRAAILNREKVQLCMECGCCSYVCPAHRPLAENNSAARSFIRKYNKAAAEKAAENKEGGK